MRIIYPTRVLIREPKGWGKVTRFGEALFGSVSARSAFRPKLTKKRPCENTPGLKRDQLSGDFEILES